MNRGAMLWPVARHCHVRYSHPNKLGSLPALMTEWLSAAFGVVAQAVATASTGSNPVQLYLADDSAMLAETLRSILSNIGEFEFQAVSRHKLLRKVATIVSFSGAAATMLERNFPRCILQRTGTARSWLSPTAQTVEL